MVVDEDDRRFATESNLDSSLKRSLGKSVYC